MSGGRVRGSAPLVALVLVLGLGPLVPARAQDDWALEREGSTTTRRPRARARRPPADLPARYLEIVLADPRDGFGLDRLLALHRGDSFATLEAALEGARAREPGHAIAVELVRARLDRERGDAPAARARYAAITEGPLAWLAALGLYQLDRIGAPSTARTHLERALALAPDSERDELGRLLGELCLDLGDFDGAARAYATLGTAERSVHLRTELARALAARGEHERALAAYLELAAQLAGDRRVRAPLLVEVAREELALGRLDDAVATLERARRAVGPEEGVRGELVELLHEAHRRRGTLASLAGAWERSRAADELLGRARILDELGRDDEAVLAYRRAARARRRDVEPRLGEIQVLLRAARIDEAIDAYEALLRVAPRPAFVVALAELLETNGRGEEARRLADEIVAHAGPAEEATLEALAALFRRWDDTVRAIAALERRVALRPDDAVAIVALGDERLAAGDAEGAYRTFRRVLDLGGDPAARHAELGAVLLDHDRLDEALSELERALSMEGERGGPRLETLRLRALAAERAGRASSEEAWRAVLDAADAEPAIGREAREHLVAGWARTRRLELQITELRAAFSERDPPDLGAGRLLAEALRRRGDLDGAVAALRRIDELASGDLDALELLERLEIQRGDPSGAIDALERLARAEPRLAPARYRRMAEHALGLYRVEDALRYARSSVEFDPGDAESWLTLGGLLGRHGDAAESRTALQRAHELAPQRFDFALALADAEREVGDTAAALSLLVEIVARSPDDALLGAAARRLVDLADAGMPAALDALEGALLSQILRRPDRVELRRRFLDLVAARANTAPDHETLRRLVERGLAPLLLSVGSADPTEASRAIALLARAGIAAAAGTLLARAEREGDTRVRLEALAAFLPMAGGEHAARLEALALAGDASIRRLSIWGLMRADGDAASRERALTAWLADPDREVRAIAALALGGRSDTPLEGAARRAAEAALAEAGGELPLLAWAFARTFPSEIVRRLAPTSLGPHPIELLALGRSGAPEARRILVEALLCPATREAAARAMRGRLRLADDAVPRPGESAEGLLARTLDSGPLDTEQLSQVLADVLPEALAEVHADGLPAPRARAALELLVPASDGAPGLLCAGVSEVGGPPLGPALLAATRAPLEVLAACSDDTIRAQATALLAAGARRDDPSFFLALLETAPPSVLRGALEARGPRSLGDLLPIVERASAHRDWSVRRAAVVLLGAASENEGALVAAAADDYALVRSAAVEALGAALHRSDAGDAALVHACANDPEERVRRRAAQFVACE